jgi:TolA-binding protein
MLKNITFNIFLILGLSLSSLNFMEAAQFNKKEEDAFYVAVKAYEDGFYDVSMTMFERFLKTYISSDKKPEALLYTGQCYFYQEKYLKALDQFEALLKMDGAERIKDKVLFWLGEVYSRGRDYKQAAEFYKQLTNNYKGSSYYLAAYRSLALAQMNDAKLKEARDTYRFISVQFKDEAVVEEALFGICETFYRMRDYANLKKELSVFVTKYPNSKLLGRAYFYLGEANFYLELYDEAITAYRDSQNASLDEEMDLLSRIGTGWSYLRVKRFKEAKEVFSRFETEDQPLGVTLGRAVLESGLGSFEVSLELFDNVIARDKDGEYAPIAYFGRAEALYNLSRFQESIIAYRISLDKLKVAAGGYADSKELRDKIHYGLAWSYLKVGDFRSAVDEFQKVASLSTDKIFKLSALCQMGDAYQDAGEYKKAVETYRAFLEDYPDSVYNDYVQYQLGMTWLKTDNLDSAILAFRKLLKDYPTSKLTDSANYFIGVAYFQKGDFSAAAEQLKYFSDNFKDSSYRPEAVFLLGEAFLNLSRWKDSIDVFLDILKGSLGSEALRQKAEYEIASAYAQMGNEAEANKRFADFIAHNPDSHLSPDIIFWLGESYLAKKDYLSARKYFERLIRNYPQHEFIADAFLEMGVSFMGEGNQDRALTNFQQAKDYGKKGTLAKAYLFIGDIYALRSDLDNALKNYQEAVSVGYGFGKTACVKTASVYRKKKLYKEAVAFLDKALDIEGTESNAEIQFNIAELLEEQGAAQEALEAYLRVSYLYPGQDAWVVKALLRVARVYEDKGNLGELKNILEKIAAYSVPEAKYAKEKLSGLSAR